jgi:hypothetical protein
MEQQPYPSRPSTPEQRFASLDGMRNGLLRRCEQYAKWTIPKVFPDKTYNQDTWALVQDYQSLGAQAVNNLCNRLMLALFAPSRPFFRLAPNAKLKRKMANAGASPEDTAKMDNQFSSAEKEAAEVMDRKSVRSRMYDLLKLLIVTGNGLMVLEKGTIRVLSMRNYVVKRNVRGEVTELVVKESVHKDTLDPTARALCERRPEFKPEADGTVWYYHWIRLQDDKYLVEQWVGDIKLPPQFMSKYTMDRLPFRAVTWDLAAGMDYGTGLVEDFANDFAALSAMARATVQAAILASEFRWLVNPMGLTSPEDFEKTPNGASIPGNKGDVELITAGVQGNLQVNLEVMGMYVNRIGSGFLLTQAVVRDSERTTMYEVRKLAEELEGGLGGAYSRIAVDIQIPVAYWSMDQIDKGILGSDIEPIIITGLAALSRTGDRDRMMIVAQHIAQLSQMPPAILQRLKLSVWLDDIASSEGLERGKYFISEEQFAQDQAVARQQAINDQVQQGLVTQELNNP